MVNNFFSPCVAQIPTHCTTSALSKTLAATSSPNDHASMGHSGQRIGKTILPVLPSASLDCRYDFRHFRQYACSWGQGRRRPNGRRDEEVGPFETVAGFEVTRKHSKHIPQVGIPVVAFVGGGMDGVVSAGAFPLPFTFATVSILTGADFRGCSSVGPSSFFALAASLSFIAAERALMSISIPSGPRNEIEMVRLFCG